MNWKELTVWQKSHQLALEAYKVTSSFPFLYNARGSLEETRYHLLLSRDLDYLSPFGYEDLEAGYEEVSKMLNRLISRIKNKL